MKKRELVTELALVEASRDQYRDCNHREHKAYFADLHEWDKRMTALQDDLKTAQDDLWLAQAKADLYVEVACLPSYHTHPLTCPYCGSADVVKWFCESVEPDVGEKTPGHPARLDWNCEECNAELGHTRTLEGGNEER